MRIGCLMVTEKRPHVVGIALASFAGQTHDAKELLIITDDCSPRHKFSTTYNDALERAEDNGVSYSCRTSPHLGVLTVCQRLDEGAQELFAYGCDAIAIWDDDDWRYPGFLSDVEKCFDANPEAYLTACAWNHHINARHLWAENLKERARGTWGYLGCTLTFKRAAWEKVKFTEFPFVGYDPKFCGSFNKNRWGTPVSNNPFDVLSFCHGTNVYQMVRGSGKDFKPWIRENLAPYAVDEIFRTRQYMIDNDLEPPQVKGRPY